MNTCTKVFLRQKAISGGRISLYLDFYPAIRNPHTNRMSRRETLGIYIYASPKNERERQFNSSMLEKAEAIRCRRFEQLLNEQFDFLDKEKLRMDFLAYFKQKCRQKYQKWDCVLRHFEIYCKGKCRFCDLTVDFCKGLYLSSICPTSAQQWERANLTQFGSRILVDIPCPVENGLSGEISPRECQ